MGEKKGWTRTNGATMEENIQSIINELKMDREEYKKAWWQNLILQV